MSGLKMTMQKPQKQMVKIIAKAAREQKNDY